MPEFAQKVLLHQYLVLFIIVRFLVLVTMMVTKVDHSNYRSNDRSNHCGYYDQRWIQGRTVSPIPLLEIFSFF